MWAKIKQRKKLLIIVFIILVILIGIINTYCYMMLRRVENEKYWTKMNVSSTQGVTNHSQQEIFEVKASYFDFFSNDQLYKSGIMYKDTGKITDALKPRDNTFTWFNEISAAYKGTSKLSYASFGAEGANYYPLYLGDFLADQTSRERWNRESVEENYNGWTAYANMDTYTTDSVYDEHGFLKDGKIGAVSQGLVSSQLDQNGNIVQGQVNKKRKLPFFDEDVLGQKLKQDFSDIGTVVQNTSLAFHRGDSSQTIYMDAKGEKEDEDYVYFDSSQDVISIDAKTNTLDYYYNDHQVKDANGVVGFFPFNNQEDSEKESLNFGFATKMELNCNMPLDGKNNGKDLIFEVSASDDVWVFVDGYLALDMGGIHKTTHGIIDFATQTVTVDCVQKKNAEGSYSYESSTFDFSEKSSDYNGKLLHKSLENLSQNHSVSVFYVNRGKSGSVLKLKTNLQTISKLSIGNELSDCNVNEFFKGDDLWKVCDSYQFQYDIYARGEQNAKMDELAATTSEDRVRFTPISLDSEYRNTNNENKTALKKISFYTFLGENYCAMVSNGTKVKLPDLSQEDKIRNIKKLTDKNSVYRYNGIDYVFIGWTTDVTYKYNFQKILTDEYIGTAPDRVEGTQVVVNENQEYYAVWIKQRVKISYYDEVDVDPPLGYDVEVDEKDSTRALIGTEIFVRNADTVNTRLWAESDLADKRSSIILTRETWNTDKTRGGFTLNGWSEERKATLIERDIYSADSKSFLPMCNVNLYADWTRKAYRVMFKTEAIPGTSVGEWQSEIQYVPEHFLGILPFMRYDSKHGDFTVVSNGVSCFDFLKNGFLNANQYPELKGYGVVMWKKESELTAYEAISRRAPNSDDPFENIKCLAPGKMTEYYTTDWTDANGETHEKSLWVSPDKDVILTGKWEKIGENYLVPTEKTDNKVEISFDFQDEKQNIEGLNKSKEHVVTCYYSKDEKLKLPCLEDFGKQAPYDRVGTQDNTTHYVYINNMAYAVKGWATDKRRLHPVTEHTKVTKNMTLYAIWKPVYTELTVIVEKSVIISQKQKVENEWDSESAKAAGWTEDESGCTIRLKMIPGRTIGSYLSKTGSLWEKLSAGDYKNDMEHFYELKYGTLIWAGGNYQLGNVSKRVPYSNQYPEASLVGYWELTNILVQFFDTGYTNDLENAVPIGYGIYTVGTRGALPGTNSKLLSIDGKKELSVDSIQGFRLAGWKIQNDNHVQVSFMPTENLHKMAFYTVWEKDVILSEEYLKSKEQQTDETEELTSNIMATRDKDTLGTFGKIKKETQTNLKKYFRQFKPIAIENYLLRDLLVLNEQWSVQTMQNRRVTLTYDQVANYFNYFRSGNEIKLNEKRGIYKKNGELLYDYSSDYFETTWELRDAYGVIVNRNDGTNLISKKAEDKKDIPVYDGRVSGEETGAFLFQNQEVGNDIEHDTSISAIFTHKIKVASLEVKAKECEDDETCRYKVLFYNLFGGETNHTQYYGSYYKKDAYGKIICDEESNMIEYKAKDGYIELKGSETAIISGIPVHTSFGVYEEDSFLNDGELKEGDSTYLFDASNNTTESTPYTDLDREIERIDCDIENISGEKYASMTLLEEEVEVICDEMYSLKKIDIAVTDENKKRRVMHGDSLEWAIVEEESSPGFEKCAILASTFIAGDMEGDVVVKGIFNSREYKKNREVGKIVFHVKKQKRYNLYYDTTFNQNGDENPDYVLTARTSAASGKTSKYVIDNLWGDPWVAEEQTFGSDEYLAIMFRKDDNLNNKDFVNRVISKIDLYFEKEKCERTIELYALQGLVKKNSSSHSLTESTCIFMGKQVLGKDKTKLSFDFLPKDMEGFKVVFRYCTDDTLAPSMQEVQVYGK